MPLRSATSHAGSRAPRAFPLRALLLAFALLLALPAGALRADDDVMLQGFWWDCGPKGQWYPILRSRVPALKKAGFSAVCLPPASKGASGADSMGYDVFDHYDLGNYNQKGTIATHFGTLGQLRFLVQTLHRSGRTQGLG